MRSRDHFELFRIFPLYVYKWIFEDIKFETHTIQYIVMMLQDRNKRSFKRPFCSNEFVKKEKKTWFYSGIINIHGTTWSNIHIYIHGETFASNRSYYRHLASGPCTRRFDSKRIAFVGTIKRRNSFRNLIQRDSIRRIHRCANNRRFYIKCHRYIKWVFSLFSPASCINLWKNSFYFFRAF